MKNNKPRGKTPSLIGSSNGRPQKVVVKRKIECCRCCDDIYPGQDCFGIPRIGSGFSNLKKYCKECFGKVVAQTYEDLEKIKNL